MINKLLLDPNWSNAIIQHGCADIVGEMLRVQWAACAKLVKASGPVPRVAQYRECLAWEAASQPWLSLPNTSGRKAPRTFPVFVEVYNEIHLFRTCEQPDVAQVKAEEFIRDNPFARASAIRAMLGLDDAERRWAYYKARGELGVLS